MIIWTTELRDALMLAEVAEWHDEIDHTNDHGRNRLVNSLVALATIPVGAVLNLTNFDYDGDVPPGPTGDFVDMLITYYGLQSLAPGHMSS